MNCTRHRTIICSLGRHSTVTLKRRNVWDILDGYNRPYYGSGCSAREECGYTLIPNFYLEGGRVTGVIKRVLRLAFG